MPQVPDKWRWFAEARFGMFIHWGPYAQDGRGEQVMQREAIDQRHYAARARAWNPKHYDPHAWADLARRAGCKYAVLTARHHDGYCLWDSRHTDYTAARQAPRRDFVHEYVEAFRAKGLRVGLYYSLGDWRIPALFNGPDVDRQAWEKFRDYAHAQVKELVTNYGKIDVMWFDGAWPRSADEWKSQDLIRMIRAAQPDILINNRVGGEKSGKQAAADGGLGAGESATLGDYGTPEHRIVAEKDRLWESCQVATWRLWCYAPHERWRPADLLLDFLCECAEKGGNLLLNVGPDEHGRLPAEFVSRMEAIGRWLDTNGQAIYASENTEAFIESVLFGRVTRKANTLYLIIRFYPPHGFLNVPGLATPIKSAVMLDPAAPAGLPLKVIDYGRGFTLTGLPPRPPTELFSVIKLDLEGPPKRHPWYDPGQWLGDPTRYTPWAEERGTSVWSDGNER